MKRKNLLLALLLIPIANVKASETPKYPVKDISEDMKKGMYAVIREEFHSFEILARNKSSERHRKVITILNQKANDYASLHVNYDKLTKIEDIKAAVYDAEGNLIKRLKANEIRDQSAVSGYSLFEDTRVKWADLSQSTYPYTIEYEYEITYRFLYSIPGFALYSDDEISIQKTAYSIIYPLDLKPKYKVNNIKEPKASSINGVETLEWSFENIVPEKFERYCRNEIPTVIATPVSFEYGGYAGKMDTWENLGLWQLSLNKGRDVLPEATKNTIRSLTADLTSTEEKTKILYEYLQNKTRYVSIQRGIGGCQPFEAAVVDRLGYGDCKALSNYMVALLKEVGIKGYYTQVHAGANDRPVPLDFTIDYFNHIIVAVPDGRDTLWMECTDQTQPFGFLGSFTCDRYALMITENGGKLVKTPSYKKIENLQTRVAHVKIDMSGNGEARIQTTYSGLRYEKGGLDGTFNSTDRQKKWLEKMTDIPSYDMLSFSMTNHKNKIPSAEVEVNITLKRYASISGKRLFLTPNLMNRSSFIPEKTESRKNKITVELNSTDVDTVNYKVPDEMYPEFIPETIKIQSRFGDYEATFKLDQGSLTYIRKFRMYKGDFPAESYQEFTDFYKSISKADNMKLVFLNKT